MKKFKLLKYSIATIACLFIISFTFAQQVNDNEIKKNVENIASPLQKLLLLDPKIYEYNTSKFRHLNLQSGRQYGFIAEDVQNVFPEVISVRNVSYMFGKNSYRNTLYKTIDESKLIPVLVAAIKEQQQQIEELKATFESLKSKTSLP